MVTSQELMKDYNESVMQRPAMIALRQKCELEIRRLFTPSKIVDVMLDDDDPVPNYYEMEALRKAIDWQNATYYPKRFWRQRAYIRFDDNYYSAI